MPTVRTFICMFADVVFPQRRYCLFTYTVPPRLTDRIRVGSRVLVPLGRHLVPGFVFALTDRLSEAKPGISLSTPTLRAIHELIDTPLDFPLHACQIALAKRVTDYYLAPPAAGLRLMLPPMRVRRPATRYVLTEEGKRAIHEHARLSESEKSLLVRLLRHPKGLTATTLSKTSPDAARMLARLARKAWIRALETAPLIRSTSHDRHEQTSRSSATEVEPHCLPSPLVQGEYGTSSPTCPPHTEKHLDRDEEAGGKPGWWNAFIEACAQRYDRAFLLQALRERRSTLLIQAIEAALAHGRPALVLTPEIDQSEALAHCLCGRFGQRVTVYHSELSIAERAARWLAVRKGIVSVVVGTHLALFLPFSDLGMIWLEQEEHPSFKAEQTPYYHARTVAEMRAEIHKAPLIFSTAYPSLETYHRFSMQADRAEATLPSSWPCPRIVPLHELAFDEVLSDAMIQEMTQTLEAGEQVILFVNRKGFARTLQCRDCGHILRCERCGIALVFHQHPSRLACPYCPRTRSVPEICPNCLSPRWRSSGFGTERVESRVRTLFPSVATARFDRESVPSRAQEAAICQAFARGEIRILIGTELLIRTQTMPRASFVGLPYADAGLHLPDFRAAERMYHVLSDVLGLAKNPASRIVLQTALPTHHVLCALAERDPAIFYTHELALRQMLGYPPFAQLVQLTMSGRSKDAVEAAALAYAARLRAHLREAGWIPESASSPTAEPVLGPIPVRPRSTNHRWVLLLKNRDLALPIGQILREVNKDCERLLKTKHVTCEINVDPLEMR
ncbi:MAG: primosomal protein N' [Nitrospirae bacterium]|nr:MAG: primosomal protein N' [Nitrospirota bacterium]